MDEMKNILSILFILIVLNLFAQIPPGYYDGTEGLSGEELKTALYDIIKDHIAHSYDALRDSILPDTDEDPINPDNVILLYTGWSLSKDDFGGGPSDWNREHVWAKSHGDFGNDPPPGTDAHHIRPTDVSVNSARGNLDFDNGGTEYIDGDGPTGCFRDEDSWEPRDAVKGDVARMIFYMEVRYEGENGEPDLEMVDYIPSSPTGQPYHGLKSTLLEWHLQDPGDDWEIQRNDKVYFYQENRNPFIDHPEFVDLIWNPVSADENQISLSSFNLHNYPNPFNPTTIISFSLTTEITENTELSIYNIRGQKIRVFTFPNRDLGTSEYSVVWNGTDSNNKSVASGIYFYQLRVNNIPVQTRKCVLIK
jgi:endonuclease I